MSGDIALLLIQDGVTNAAIYALLALAFVLVFSVTRIIFVPQGEFVTYGALTLATIEAGKFPRGVWLLLVLGIYIGLRDGLADLRAQRSWAASRTFVRALLVPVIVLAATIVLMKLRLPLFGQTLLALLIVVPLAPMVYKVAFEPAAGASVLVLFMLAVAVHFALVGTGLLLFGAEGSRTSPTFSSVLQLDMLVVPAQSLWIIGASVTLMGALYLFFNHSLTGKALRATAINQVGARLVGIGPIRAGMICFTLAGFIGALSGIFISPITAIYYDSGLTIGLKGLVAATLAGLTSYPVAALGAAIVGLVEAFSSFYASAFKDVIVFALIVPILLVRVMSGYRVEGGEE
jgi:branched-subunit amino acid ABC-type transport system permease component